MKRLFRLCQLAAIASLTACSSTPVHYYTLLAPAEQGTAAGAPSPFLIEVLPVGVPAQADQPQLVVRQGSGAVAVLEGERWAGPLSDEIREALSAALTRSLGTQDVAGLARPGDMQLMRIKVQVRRFDNWPGKQVQLDADWSLGMADEPVLRLSCREQLAASVPGGYAELVQGQQGLIAELGNRIGAGARAWAQSRKVACSQLKQEQ